MTDKEIISEKECAELLGVDVKTLSRPRRRGKPIFPFVLVGDMPRYSRSVVLAQFTKKPEPDAAATTTVSITRQVGRPRKPV